MYENPYMQNPYLQQQRFGGFQYQQPQQMQQVQPVQQPQFQQQFPQLIGRTVNRMEEITANDVPMNAPYALFPKADLSEIYLKSWTANGTIQTVAFKPVLNGNIENSTNNQPESKIGLSDDAIQAFMNRFDEVTSKIDELEKVMSGTNNSVRQKTKTSVQKKEDAE